MTAQEFYRAFQDSVSDESFETDYKNSPKWTRRISQIIESILNNNNLEFEKEYYRIDYIGWDKPNDTMTSEAEAVDMKPCLWNLKVAIEHENDQSDWTYELVKLIHISCPLKVVVGYSPCDERDSGGYEERRLEYAAKLMNRVDAFKYTSDDEYLLILGNTRPTKKYNPLYTNCGYKGYIYKEGRFCSI